MPACSLPPSSAQHHRFNDKQYYGNDIGQHGAARQRYDTGHDTGDQTSVGDVHGDPPHNGRYYQLNVGYQAGGKEDGTHLGAIAEFQNGRDGVDEDCCVKLICMVVIGIIELTQVKTEIQGERHYDKEAEDNLFRIHRYFFLYFSFVADPRSPWGASQTRTVAAPLPDTKTDAGPGSSSSSTGGAMRLIRIR